MRDFSKPYRDNNQVKYFGIWMQDDADSLGKRDAWEILKKYYVRIRNEDIRCEEMEEALTFIEKQCPISIPFRQFREALDIQDPDQRCYAAKKAMTRIWRSLN